MRGLPFNAQGKGALQLVEQQEELQKSILWNRVETKRVKREGLEPTSVLDHRRSPSPPTSTSTLSSSLGGGGGGGSSDTAGVAAVSGNNPTHKWGPSGDQPGGGGGDHELQPIPAGLEMGFVGGGEKCGMGVEEWETMLSESAASPGQEQTFLRWIMGDVDDPGIKQHSIISPGAAEFDGGNAGLGFGLVDPPAFALEPIGGIGSSSAISPLQSGGLSLASSKLSNLSNQISNPLLPPQPPVSLPPAMFFPEPLEDRPQLLGFPNFVLNHHHPQSQASPNPSPAFFLPLPPYNSHVEHPPPPPPQVLLPPQPSRHHPMDSSGGVPELFLRRNQQLPLPPQGVLAAFPQLHSTPFHLQPRPMKPKAAAADEAAAAAAAQQQQQALLDQLFEAAKMVEAGNFVGARGILARLNHQLPSPAGKPLLRSAFYFKEALHLVLANSPTTTSSSPAHHHRSPFPNPLATPYDVMLKLSAYKAFSEGSPVLQFANFTCIQVLLEELAGADRIHIIDFDIGVGGQWSSFMQELAQRRCTAAGAIPMLKVTAFVPFSSHHPLELHLTRENLSHFASDLNIPFEFNILSLDSFDPSELLAMGDEAIAVNLPVGSAQNPSFPTILRLVKQLSPKIVVSVDHGCDRSELPFAQHFLHAFQSCTFLLDSIDSAGTNLEVANKIERFLLQPRIEGAVLGRHLVADKMLPWKILFASAGFAPMQFSNFTETQAECLLKRVQVRGFHVEKRQTSLVLFWQRGELVSVSAWRC
ncbi:uncharacterized protein [Typha latifolia]|uniref:uncharacterized protein n=1 Tax=Typha latifolia TaxID=4733 RepID=UPI003C2B5866